jgi:uncharacterized RDD family membrane protein YckC
VTNFDSAGADSSLGVETPEGIEFVLYPAGFLIRACAWGIDALIQGTLTIALAILLELLGDFFGFWILLILMFVLDWFYHVAFEIFRKGQTPGKRIMGIRVVHSDGSPVSPGSSFLRNLMRFADTFMFLYLIVFICMTASSGFRRFGDWAGNTLVVYTEKALSPGRFTAPIMRQPGIPWLEDIPALVPSRQLSYQEKQGLLMFARRYPILGKARADEIARGWASRLRGQASREDGVSDSEYLLGIAHTLVGSA